jgi:hypothetical protein
MDLSLRLVEPMVVVDEKKNNVKNTSGTKNIHFNWKFSIHFITEQEAFFCIVALTFQVIAKAITFLG